MAAYDDFLQLHLSFWLSTVDIQFRMRINRTLNILVRYIIIGYDHFFQGARTKESIALRGLSKESVIQIPGT